MGDLLEPLGKGLAAQVGKGRKGVTERLVPGDVPQQLGVGDRGLGIFRHGLYGEVTSSITSAA